MSISKKHNSSHVVLVENSGERTANHPGDHQNAFGAWTNLGPFGLFIVIGNIKTGECIASVLAGVANGNGDRNARLISAAPQLLAAAQIALADEETELQTLLGSCCVHKGDGSYDESVMYDSEREAVENKRAVISQLKEAIEKAVGK